MDVTLIGPSLRRAARLRLGREGFSMSLVSGGPLRPRRAWVDTGPRSYGCIACGSTMSVAPTVLTQVAWLWGAGHRCRTEATLDEPGAGFDANSEAGLLAYDAYLRDDLAAEMAAHAARQPVLGALVERIDALAVPGTPEADALAAHQRLQGGTRPFCSCSGGAGRGPDRYWPCPAVATMALLHGIVADELDSLDGYDWPGHCPRLHRTIAASVAATVAAGAPPVPGIDDLSTFPARRDLATYRGYGAGLPGQVQVWPESWRAGRSTTPKETGV